jgi:uroporphyrinogen-III synthase
MSRPLEGKVIALAEGRQLEDLVRLLEAEGAVPLRCPMLGILDAPDAEPVVAWLRDLIGGRIDLLVLMTGEAVRRLRGFAERAGLRDEYVAALGRTPTLTRGPKPGRALKELGLAPTRVAPQPTTEGVIAALQSEQLTGRTVGMTLYAEPNPLLEGFITKAGATARPVLSYVYAPAADDERVLDLVDRLASGAVAATVFTSAPQIDRLFEVAGKHGVEATLRQGLARTCIAAVGPVVAERLRERGLTATVCPEQGFQMKNLVQHLKRAFEAPGQP